jgi:periplasmic divalent cation tolerance protein
MKMYYITLHHPDVARTISLSLLEKKLIACANWFPISSAYHWEGVINECQEIVLIVKTQDNMRDAIENVIAEHISYTNYIAELDVHSVNEGFLNWMQTIVDLHV